MFEVRSDVPLPPPVPARKYPWAELEVGDYFVVMGRTSRRWASQCAMRSRRDGRRYSVRKIEMAGLEIPHFRIFRVA